MGLQIGVASFYGMRWIEHLIYRVILRIKKMVNLQDAAKTVVSTDVNGCSVVCYSFHGVPTHEQGLFSQI